ncbi:MAG: folate-binding protein YgfZ [Chthoniobacterales bacterium]|nr:folate-binding protein YgfZ [Chthoniobacterales bacterium]
MLFDLSSRTKLRLTGNDRVRYLNGQVTNDVRKANANLAMEACVLSAKGKIDALIFISAGMEELLLDTDPELREALPARLERYIIADDVTLEDVTDRFSLFHSVGEKPPNLPNEFHWRRGKRFGVAGWDLLLDAGEHEHVRQSLAATDSLGDVGEMERFRIEQGVPRWGRELSAEIIPVEANLEGNAIDYGKGCYIGQEVISRMKMSGQTNKLLCGLVSLEGTPLAPAMKLFDSVSGKEVGRITSATRSERVGKEIALGYLKRGFRKPGTKLMASSWVEVVELPFALG